MSYPNKLRKKKFSNNRQYLTLTENQRCSKPKLASMIMHMKSKTLRRTEGNKCHHDQEIIKAHKTITVVRTLPIALADPMRQCYSFWWAWRKLGPQCRIHSRRRYCHGNSLDRRNHTANILSGHGSHIVLKIVLKWKLESDCQYRSCTVTRSCISSSRVCCWAHFKTWC